MEGFAKAKYKLRGRISELDVITLNAYAIAVKNGFDGTEEDWLASLNGASGDGSGDMVAEIYDPQNKRRDIFKYVDDKVDAIAPKDVTVYIAEHNEAEDSHADIREAVSTAKNTADEAKETAEIAQAAATNEDLVKLIDDKLQTVGGIEVAMGGGGDVRNLVIQKITESCTWTAPKAQDQLFKVFAVGGGGGGGNKNDSDSRPGGGGGGYVVIEELTIPEGEAVDIVCGAGGYAGKEGTNSSSSYYHGSAGGATLFGRYITADGGQGGTSWQNDGTQYTGGDGGAGGGGGGLFGGNGGTYGGGGGGGGGRGGGNGGTYGGGGGSGCWETDSPNDTCVGGTGGTYGGAGGGAGKNGVGAQPGTLAAFAFSDHLGKEMSMYGKAGKNSVTSTTSQRYGLGGGGGGYGGNGGNAVVSDSSWSSGGGGGGGYGGNGGNGNSYGDGGGGGGGGNYGGNGGNASMRCGGGGGGLFCNGADGDDYYAGGGGGIVDGGKNGGGASTGTGGSGGCYIMYFKEV